MNEQPFSAPTIDVMNGLLPAFDFVSLIMSNNDQAVYLASQKSLDRHVAIKVHSPEACADQDFKDAFEVMARQMAKLNHVNLIGVYNSGIVDGMLYLVMEFVPGKPLQQLLKGKSLDPAQVAGVMDGICSGLARAHLDGIVHGGLSPLNVLVTPEYEPKIGNFGFVTTSSSDGDDTSSRYIAPELWGDEGELSSFCDVYSLGVVLYELYTGKPFAVGVVPPELASPAGRKVLEVIKKATDKDPNQRYDSVEGFQLECMHVLPNRKGLLTAKVKLASKAPAVPKSPIISKSRLISKSPAVAKSPAVSRSPAVSNPVAATAAPQISRGGHQLRMVIHLVIIAVLCYAIYIVWNRLENEKTKSEETSKKQLLEKIQREEQIKAQQAAARAAQQKRLEELQNRINQNKPPDPTANPDNQVTEVKPVENPFESLEKLRKQLLAGDRSRMPAGTVKNGDGYYLLIDQAMSWSEASWFAESYGAHLAIPSPETSLEWLQNQFNSHASESMWIGAARSGRDAWALADGSIWKPSGLPQSGGDFISLSKDGKLQAGKTEKKLPFVMQWRADGSNPGALAKLLQRTQLSISQARPVYPPGTLAFGVRHYLYVAQPISWEKAAALAQTGGGHLLVVSAVAEAFNIDKMIGGLPVKDGIWAGGHCKSGKWSWVTKEPWDQAKWRGADAPKAQNAALLIRPGMGWKEQDPLQMASGFIIEWSPDASNASK